MANKPVIIAPVGDNSQALFIGMREYPAARVILISHTSMLKEADSLKKDLSKFGIPTRIVKIQGEIWEETFAAVSKIKEEEGKDANIIVNVATGDKMTQCAATSAAFVNGLKALNVMGNEAMLLPVMKFSYYKMLTDRKIALLKLLYKASANSLEEMSKKTGMSLPLLSYHINGNLKSEGLKQLGLVETKELKGRLTVKLSTLGKMLIKGHVKADSA